MEILLNAKQMFNLWIAGIDGGNFTYPEDFIKKESSSSLSMLKSLHFSLMRKEFILFIKAR